MATADAWNSFTSEWSEVLHAPKRVELLKMKDAYALDGEFANLTRMERDSKLRALSAVAGKHSIFAQVASLRHADFRRAFHGIRVVGPKRRPKKLTPYDLLFHKIIKDATDFVIDTGLEGPLEFVFDEQGRLGERCAETYRRSRSLLTADRQRVLGGRPTFRSDTSFQPLQAADGVAWMWRRHAEAELQIRFSSMMVHPFASGLGELPTTLSFLTYQELLDRRVFIESRAGSQEGSIGSKA
jgi:hypothetical protein